MNILCNQSIYLKYNIVSKYVAGLVLEGWEVKYIKINRDFQIKNSFIIYNNNEFFIKNSFINKCNKNVNSNSGRDRKLLLKKKEIKEIKNKIYKNNLKLLPLSILIKNNFIKMNIVIVSKKIENEKNI